MHVFLISTVLFAFVERIPMFYFYFGKVTLHIWLDTKAFFISLPFCFLINSLFSPRGRLTSWKRSLCSSRFIEAEQGELRDSNSCYCASLKSYGNGGKGEKNTSSHARLTFPTGVKVTSTGVCCPSNSPAAAASLQLPSFHVSDLCLLLLFSPVGWVLHSLSISWASHIRRTSGVRHQEWSLWGTTLLPPPHPSLFVSLYHSALLSLSLSAFLLLLLLFLHQQLPRLLARFESQTPPTSVWRGYATSVGARALGQARPPSRSMSHSERATNERHCRKMPVPTLCLFFVWISFTLWAVYKVSVSGNIESDDREMFVERKKTSGMKHKSHATRPQTRLSGERVSESHGDHGWASFSGGEEEKKSGVCERKLFLSL